MPEGINTNFNYIVTIHNKEFLIKDVILAVISCMGNNSILYPVLDGCTDASESIIDSIIKSNPKVKIVKLYANDVHELKSINIGLNSSSQIDKGFNIVLQDDVILQDTEIESKIIHLYDKFSNLGIVSFRHGGNISRALFKSTKISDLVYNHIENESGHFPNPLLMLKTGFFTFREIAIKSPICIPFKVVRSIGVPDERYAPWDDLAYCYSAIEAGFDNGIFAVDYISDVEWGTTRKKDQKTTISDVQVQNIQRFKSDHHQIKSLNFQVYNGRKFLIFNSNKQYRINFLTLPGDILSSIKKIIKDYLKNRS